MQRQKCDIKTYLKCNNLKTAVSCTAPPDCFHLSAFSLHLSTKLYWLPYLNKAKTMEMKGNAHVLQSFISSKYRPKWKNGREFLYIIFSLNSFFSVVWSFSNKFGEICILKSFLIYILGILYLGMLRIKDKFCHETHDGKSDLDSSD